MKTAGGCCLNSDNHMLCKAFLWEEGGSHSETKGACVIDGVTSPSELLDCKVRLRGIYVCGDSSAQQALACPAEEGNHLSLQAIKKYNRFNKNNSPVTEYNNGYGGVLYFVSLFCVRRKNEPKN